MPAHVQLDAVNQEIGSLQKKMQAVLNDAKPAEEKLQAKGVAQISHMSGPAFAWPSNG